MLVPGFSESTYLSQDPRGEGVMTEGEKGPGTLSWENRICKILEASLVGSGYFNAPAQEEGLDEGGEAMKMNRTQVKKGHECLFWRQWNHWEVTSRWQTWARAHFTEDLSGTWKQEGQEDRHRKTH